MIEIQLDKEQVALVDDSDADLASLKWTASFNPAYSGGGKYVAVRYIYNTDGTRTRVLMHRVIMGRVLGRPLLRSEKVDHIHGLTLDNRRSELRLATHSQNMMNKKVQSNNASGYKGVYYRKSMNKWRAEIQVNRKKIRLGYFDTPEEAHEAYCKAGREHHGDFFNPG